MLFPGLRGLWACADCWLKESRGLALPVALVPCILCAQCECAGGVKDWVTIRFVRSEETCSDRMQPMCHKSLGVHVVFSWHWYLWGFFLLAQSSWERKTCWWPWAGLLWGHSSSPLSSATGFKRELTTCFSISSATILRTVLFCFPSPPSDPFPLENRNLN